MSDANDRLEAALSKLGADREPPAGWEARVLAAIAEPPASPPWWQRWWLLAIPSTTLAAAVVLAIVLWPRSSPLALAVDIESTGPVVRGRGAHIGDVLRAHATGGAAHRALWIYRNERDLVVACPGASSCEGSGTETIATVTLGTPGEYKIVALTSSSPIPAPTGKFDDDLSRAMDAGAERKIEPLDVR